MAASAPAKDLTYRQTNTPFLLRLFYKTGGFHRPDEFDPALSRLPLHIQIYTWDTADLRELSSCLLTAFPNLLQKPYVGTRIAFRLIYPDMQAPSRPGSPARFVSRELGSVIVGAQTEEEERMDTGDTLSREGVAEALKQLDGEPLKTLADAKFVIGDYISCAIFPPLPDGTVQAVPPPPSGPSRGPPLPYSGRGRENGFGGRGDYGYGRGRGRYEDRRPSGGLPLGEWRRGEAPPEREPGYGRGGGGWSRGRGRGRW